MGWRWRLGGAVLIVLAVFAVYWPALGGQFHQRARQIGQRAVAIAQPGQAAAARLFKGDRPRSPAGAAGRALLHLAWLDASSLALVQETDLLRRVLTPDGM